MKKNVLILIGTALLLALCCNKIPDSLRSDRYIPEDTTPTENAPIVEGDWRIDTIVPGAVWKKFAGRDREITQVNQIVNVMEIDLTKPEFRVKFHYGNDDYAQSDRLRATDQVFSNKRINEGAICCINASYEVPSVYIRTDWTTIQKISSDVIPGTGVRQWKSEGCITSDGNRDVRIEYSAPAETNDYLNARAVYDRMSDRANLISSAPMLVDDGQPVGSSFTDRMIASGFYGGHAGMSQKDIERLDYENPIRHQGVTHPRTAVALTNDGKFLMITIDGRWNAAVGMTADEVTRFLLHHFPTIAQALNLDGGGSNCMCVLGRGDASNNVVNYPTDNGTFDHLGVRSVNSHIYVTYDPPAPGEGGTGE